MSASVHAGIHHPGSRHPPLGADPDPPLGADTVPPPSESRHPPPEADPPPRKQTPAYGQRAAGTHPAGMHSCLLMRITG